MDDFVSKVSERLATASSRRGFLGTMAKVAAGVAATVAGLGGGAQIALAASTLDCCHPAPGTGGCPTRACPSGTHLASYTWLCCYSTQCRPRRCYDCLNSNDTANCSYAVVQSAGGCC